MQRIMLILNTKKLKQSNLLIESIQNTVMAISECIKAIHQLKYCSHFNSRIDETHPKTCIEKRHNTQMQ